jgi:hypothetical protein
MTNTFFLVHLSDRLPAKRFRIALTTPKLAIKDRIKALTGLTGLAGFGYFYLRLVDPIVTFSVLVLGQGTFESNNMKFTKESSILEKNLNL